MERERLVVPLVVVVVAWAVLRARSFEALSLRAPLREPMSAGSEAVS